MKVTGIILPRLDMLVIRELQKLLDEMIVVTVTGLFPPEIKTTGMADIRGPTFAVLSHISVAPDPADFSAVP